MKYTYLYDLHIKMIGVRLLQKKEEYADNYTYTYAKNIRTWRNLELFTFRRKSLVIDQSISIIE